MEALLKELNDGEAPTPEEVAMIYRNMDTVLGEPTGKVEGGKKRMRRLSDGGRVRRHELKIGIVMWK